MDGRGIADRLNVEHILKESVRKSVDEPDLLTVYSFEGVPLVAPLRSHPAFEALLRKMNLAR